MGLVQCPKCGLEIFDTDTKCIYCGWNKYAKQEEPKQKKAEPKPAKPELEKLKPIAAKTEIDIPDIADDDQEIVNAIKSIAKDKNNYKNSGVDRDKYYKGYRSINGVEFNSRAIIQKHTPSKRYLITKEIMEITNCSMNEAKAFLETEIPAPKQSIAKANSNSSYYIEIPATKRMKEMQSFFERHEDKPLKTTLKDFNNMPGSFSYVGKAIVEIILRILNIK